MDTPMMVSKRALRLTFRVTEPGLVARKHPQVVSKRETDPALVVGVLSCHGIDHPPGLLIAPCGLLRNTSSAETSRSLSLAARRDIIKAGDSQLFYSYCPLNKTKAERQATCLWPRIVDALLYIRSKLVLRSSFS